MDNVKEFKKHDLIMEASQRLSDRMESFNAVSQISLYFGICLQLCKRFTVEEIESIVVEQAEMVNNRIAERKKIQ